MASRPESNPDTAPAGVADNIEGVEGGDPRRSSVEDPTPGSSGTPGAHDGSPLDPAGIADGVAGTGGENKTQDRDA